MGASTAGAVNARYSDKTEKSNITEYANAMMSEIDPSNYDEIKSKAEQLGAYNYLGAIRELFYLFDESRNQPIYYQYELRDGKPVIGWRAYDDRWVNQFRSTDRDTYNAYYDLAFKSKTKKSDGCPECGAMENQMLLGQLGSQGVIRCGACGMEYFAPVFEGEDSDEGDIDYF